MTPEPLCGSLPEGGAQTYATMISIVSNSRISLMLGCTVLTKTLLQVSMTFHETQVKEIRQPLNNHNQKQPLPRARGIFFYISDLVAENLYPLMVGFIFRASPGLTFHLSLLGYHTIRVLTFFISSVGSSAVVGPGQDPWFSSDVFCSLSCG